MLRPGLLAPEFPHASLEENLDAIARTGATAVQFDLACAVGETFPDVVTDGTTARIRRAFETRGLELAALSGTYNMIHPDPALRHAGLDGLKRVIEIASRLGCPIVTLCTGSRDAADMWRRHPDNDLPDAMDDLLVQMRAALAVAEAHGVTLAVEPEVSNTIDSAAKARQLLDETASARLGIIMDGANIFHAGELARMHAVLDEAFALLGPHIVLAHGKDLDRDGEAGHLPAGKGRLDFPYYLGLLRESGFSGPIILHALKPEEAAATIAFVQNAAPGYVA